MIVVVAILSLIVGITFGWLGAEKYIAFMEHTEHDFEELFKKNPHPELFDSDGDLDRGEYMAISFDPGFDPDEWDPDNDISVDDVL